MSLRDDVLRLKSEKKAVFLVHNYQIPEVQDIADFLGDSLGLAREAPETDARMIVFCGVRFMAETAKILPPEKTVLLPRKDAGCPMADMITREQLKALKAEHPDAKVVSYVNTSADVKAESDVCCTSANAEAVVRNLEADKIIFTPDKNLAAYCQRFVDREIIPWPGYCYVHQRITREEVLLAKEKYPDAVVLVHPECRPSVVDIADQILSTSGMVDFAKKSERKRFLIGTEEGLIYRLKKECPGKQFHTAGTAKFCRNMKLTTLKDVLGSLREERHAIDLPADIIESARRALEAMLQYV